MMVDALPNLPPNPPVVEGVSQEDLSPPDPAAPALCPNKCVLLGGLGDGLMPVPYASPLEAACRRSGWSLVQPLLSSSYIGFGDGGTLDRDCSELDELLSYLVCHRGASRFCLVGHSTGCQIAVRYLSRGDPGLVSRTKLVVLQAPVSDREHYEASHDPDVRRAHLSLARELRGDGKGGEMMPRGSFWAPISARRFLDLHDRGGADDYFSSDLANDELRDRLSHVGGALSSRRTSDGGPAAALLAAFSGSDEYVPAHVDSRALADRIVEAMNAGCCSSKGRGTDAGLVAEALYLPGANHNLSQGPGGELEAFVGRVEELLRRAAVSPE
jgi:pimeloyl-ACP methyl ester carboxylesterase